jgi:hypothetical protein
VPRDLYYDQSIEELEKLLYSLRSRQARGAITEVSAAGIRTVRAVNSKDPGVDSQIEKVLYGLHLKAVESGDSALIAKWKNPNANRVRRTIPSYLS